MSQEDYEAKKELVAEEIISRLEKKLFPGLKSSIVFKEVQSCELFWFIFVSLAIHQFLNRVMSS